LSSSAAVTATAEDAAASAKNIDGAFQSHDGVVVVVVVVVVVGLVL
jgi:hypothetical protein